MGESADSGGGGGDNVDRSNPAEMAAEKDFQRAWATPEIKVVMIADVAEVNLNTQDLERRLPTAVANPANRSF